MYNRIVLAGGTGYLGKVLADYYTGKAREIVILSRRPHKDRGSVRYEVWDGRNEGPWAQSLAGADLVVNLAGKSVNCRYTEKNRAEILNSRLDATTVLGKVIARIEHPPKLWINCASATIYRHAEDRPQDETNGEIGEGFSVDVCRRWEESFWAAGTPRTKKLLLRIGLVLGQSDGVLPRLKNLVRLGLGGRQGNGHQYVSWVHEHDLARLTEWVMTEAEDGDLYNVTAPQAVTNKELMKQLRVRAGRKIGLPTPAWLLKIGAAIIGTETELVLKSRWVYPQNLLRTGFVFAYEDIASALQDLS